MLVEERIKLENRESEYLIESTHISVGISNGGNNRVGAISVPWELTAHAYNMKIPDVFIAPEDLNDKDLMNMIKTFHVVGCYVFTQLDDYSFIAEFEDIRDVYIIDGVNVKDLSFLNNLKNWHILHLERAHLKDLKPILQSSLQKRWLPVFCLSFSECTIDDVSALYEVKQIAELIVVGEDNDEERSKWRSVPAHIHRYYTIKR